MKCQFCGQENKDTAKFCLSCGKSLEKAEATIICRYCGAELPEKAKFCDCCGKSLLDNEERKDTNSYSSDTVFPNPNKVTTGEYHQNNGSGKIDLNQINNINKKIKIEEFNKKYLKIWVGFLIIVGLFCFFAFIFKNPLAIFISILQIILLIINILIHKNLIKVAHTWYKYILFVIVILLIFLYIKCFQSTDTESTKNTESVTVSKVQAETETETEIETETETETENNKGVPIASDQCIGKNVEEIEEILNESGYNNITINEIHDIDPSDIEKNGIIETITIDGTPKFSKQDYFNEDSEIIITVHAYRLCNIQLHIHFEPNIFLNKYDVIVKFDNLIVGELPHGTDGDFETSLYPGDYKLEFLRKDNNSIVGDTTVKIDTDSIYSYKIKCDSDKILVNEEFKKEYSEVNEGDILMTFNSSHFIYNSYQNVENELKNIGFTNIKTNILYDIYFGITDEGSVANISINGISDFSAGDVFKNTDEVIITYHMKYEDDPNKPQTEAQTKESTIQETKEEGPLTYSTNNYETAKNGNSGVFSYVKDFREYDIYYIIDFDEGYVYRFTEGMDDNTCERLKIDSGTLNSAVKIYYHDGGDVWLNKLYFHYERNPNTLILCDNDGFETKFTSCSLKDALALRDTKKIKDY